MKNKLIFAVFFILLIAPVATFPFLKNFVDSKNYEKRKFADAPQLSLEALPNFPAQFEEYFNDHLPYKNQLVFLNNLKNDRLGAGTTVLEYMKLTSVIKGKEKWLFYNAFSEDEESLKDYMCSNLYDEQKLKEIAEGYTLLRQKLKEDYGIELVVLYAANKEQIYPEYMPDAIIPSGTYSRTDQLVDYIRANTDVPLLYTKEALLKEKKNHQLFYKYDTHWNNLGGFVGGQLLNEYFHGEYVSLDEVTCSAVSSGQSGDLADLLSMRNLYNDDIVWHIDDYKEDVEDTMTDGTDDFRFVSNAKDKRSLLVIMDSFGYGLMGIAKDYAKVTFMKNTDLFKEYCKELKPDAVVVEIVERRKEGQENWCRGLYDLLVK